MNVIKYSLDCIDQCPLVEIGNTHFLIKQSINTVDFLFHDDTVITLQEVVAMLNKQS